MRSKKSMLRFGLVLLLAGVIFLGQGWRAPHPARAAVTPIKVMPLGDSITSGTDSTYSIPMSSYRCLLYKSLSLSYSVDFVGSVHGQWGIPNKNLTPPGPPTYCEMLDWDEEGHSGWAIYHILNGVPNNWPGNLSIWATTYTPDVVLVHLGTNNFAYGPPEYPAPNVDDAISQLGQVIDTLRAANPHVRILLAQILPCSCDSLHMIPLFNARIPDLAASKAQPYSPIVVVDMNTGFNSTHFLADGVHPNQAGENKMAVRWQAGFDKIMKINYWTFIPQVMK